MGKPSVTSRFESSLFYRQWGINSNTVTKDEAYKYDGVYIWTLGSTITWFYANKLF